MKSHVLVIHKNKRTLDSLAHLFRRGDERVWSTSDLNEGHKILLRRRPRIVVLDLALALNGGAKLVNQVRAELPKTKIIGVIDEPDPELEKAAIQDGVQAILHPPYNRESIQIVLRMAAGTRNRAISTRASDKNPKTSLPQLPRVRFPVVVKITAPYLALAIVLAIAAAFVASRIVLDTVENRFTNQLIEAGKLSADWMVQEENNRLETLRLLSHTQGISSALLEGDAEVLRKLALPLAINAGEEAVEFLDASGASVLSLRRAPDDSIEELVSSRGDTQFRDWEFVQRVYAGQSDIEGDKFADLVRAPWGEYLYIAGPIFADNGTQVGAILVGKSLTTITRQLRQATFAQTTLYDYEGFPLASSLAAFETGPPQPDSEATSRLLAHQDTESLTRGINVGSVTYRELLAPWQVRNGEDIGLLGTALPETFLIRTSRLTLLQIFLLVVVSLLLVVAVGVFISTRITRPLQDVVRASTQVASGNLDVRVQPTGQDEITVLAHAFNHLVGGLREGSVYRDLLGRTVSPEVREQLRETFASGKIDLGGQTAMATVLIADIRGFTSISEATDPGKLMTWLNEFFGELVPIIVKHSGIVNKFDGDAVLAFFGVLPQPLAADISAYLACNCALEMLAAINEINMRRAERGEPTFVTGIGLNTGLVTAGALGAADRLHYTIIGDTVNITQRIESQTRIYEEGAILISQYTHQMLAGRQAEFEIEPLLGKFSAKGKSEPISLYRLRSRARGAVRAKNNGR